MNSIKQSAFLKKFWKFCKHISIFIHIVLMNISKEHNTSIGFSIVSTDIKCSVFHVALHNGAHFIHIAKLDKFYLIYYHKIIANNKAWTSTRSIIEHFCSCYFSTVRQQTIFANMAEDI